MSDNEREDNNEIRKKIKTTQQRMREAAVQDFIDGCYAAYEVLEERGVEALESGEPDAIKMALNRMMALFLHKEEYERCAFLKAFVETNMEGHTIQPDWEVIEDMELVKITNGTKTQ